MPAVSYRVSVESPCQGEQIVLKLAPTHFTGANGDFTYMILVRSPSEAQWEFTVYDYTGGPCTPNRAFKQIVPNADDPTGEYEGIGSGGVARISNFP